MLRPTMAPGILRVGLASYRETVGIPAKPNAESGMSPNGIPG
jgi:hypothetical protein